MNSFEPHLEILPKAQQQLWRQLEPASELGFVLYGGTAIAFDGVLQVASLDDLLARKLKVLFQRVESKDYIDIAAMIQHGISLAHGLAAASLMFGSAFQLSECLKALIYFHGGDLKLLTAQTKDTLIDAAAALHDLPQVHLQSSQLSV